MFRLCHFSTCHTAKYQIPLDLNTSFCENKVHYIIKYLTQHTVVTPLGGKKDKTSCVLLGGGDKLRWIYYSTIKANYILRNLEFEQARHFDSANLPDFCLFFTYMT